MGPGMRKRRRRRSTQSVDGIVYLVLASWETVALRSLLIAQGRCSFAEYNRMALEKIQAASLSTAWLARNPGRAGPGVIAPWRRLAVANARRLRNR